MTMSEGDGNAIKDLRIRVKSLEEGVGELKANQAVTEKALDIVSELIDTVQNHLNSLQECQQRIETKGIIVEKRLDSFIGVFKWIFPSFLVLLSIVLAVVSLMSSGKLVWV